MYCNFAKGLQAKNVGKYTNAFVASKLDWGVIAFAQIMHVSRCPCEICRVLTQLSLCISAVSQLYNYIISYKLQKFIITFIWSYFLKLIDYWNSVALNSFNIFYFLFVFMLGKVESGQIQITPKEIHTKNKAIHCISLYALHLFGHCVQKY